MGDYNELMFASEKDGGNTRPEGQMKQFQDINRCYLRDMGYNSLAFTWMNTRTNQLDRALVSIN